MSYQVLARKYRPRGFSEVIGQEHAVRALANALDRDQLHHAYLFTGTRGVGKTTLARILAACLNCETGVSSTPCGECSACVSIREGRFVDLIEVDAASRTGVDDTRDLLNNVQYLPTSGRFKVYLIDEVHMLSTSSFNALLKTLEEPPEHVKFLLATTESKRIPVTVLSRCLQINLKNIPPDTIVHQLVEILNREEIEFEEDALRTLARAADGSMRDAESLTDQAIAHGGGTVTAASVVDMLGVAGGHEIAAILEALAHRDTPKLLAVADELSDRAANLADVLGAMIRAFHDLAIGLETGSIGDETLVPFGNAFSAEDLQLYYQIALVGSRDLPFAPDAKTGFDMTLLRLGSFEPMGGDEIGSAGDDEVSTLPPTHELTAAAPGEDDSDAMSATEATPLLADPSPPDDFPVELEPLAVDTPAVTPVPDARASIADEASPARDTETRDQAIDAHEVAPARPTPAGDWFAIVEQLAPRGVALMILDNSNLVERSDARWAIRLDEDHDTLLNEKQKTEIGASICQYLGASVRIDWEVGALSDESPGARKQRLERERYEQARTSLLSSEGVQVLMREFDATLMEVTSIDPASDQQNAGPEHKRFE